jgi:hypothetical protein
MTTVDYTKVETHETTAQMVLDSCSWDTRNITANTQPVNTVKLAKWIIDSAATVNNALADNDIPIEKIKEHINIKTEVQNLIVMGARITASTVMGEIEGRVEILQGRWDEQIKTQASLVKKKFAKLRAPSDELRPGASPDKPRYDF